MAYCFKEKSVSGFVDPIDADERELISMGAYDLVLIERASEYFKDFTHHGDKLEQLLQSITKNIPDVTFIESKSFPISKKKRSYVENIIDSREDVKKALRNNEKIVTVHALELKDAGHYAAYIYDKNTKTLEIFDSMQVADWSNYTKDFDDIGKEIFQTNKIIHKGCILTDISLQETGGFIDLKHPTTKYDKMMECGIISKNELYWFENQTTESQNHFCYMWGIWYIHLNLLDYDFEEVVRRMISHKNNDPLFVIKSYIWNMVRTNPQIYKTFKSRCFYEHFRSVWAESTNIVKLINGYIECDDLRYPIFRRFGLIFDNAKTVNEAFKISIKPIGVRDEPSTLVDI